MKSELTMSYYFTAHEACAEVKMPESMELRSFAPMTSEAWMLTKNYLDGTTVETAAEATPAVEEASCECAMRAAA